jgi:uncharacterized protein
MDTLNMKELVEIIARALVDSPSEIQVNEICGQQISMLQIRSAKSDLGKIIGKQGQNINAMRTIVAAAAAKLRKRAILEIL